jgi:hypothetical protein
MSTPTHDTPPLDGSSRISPSDESYSSGSRAPTDAGSSSSELWSSHVSPQASSPDQLSTDESKPPAPGPTANHPLPASPLNPEPSTEQDPPPSTKRPRPEVNEFEGSLTKILKGKFKRRISGFGALYVAQRGLAGYTAVPITLRRTSRTLQLLSLSCQQMTVVTNILTFSFCSIVR